MIKKIHSKICSSLLLLASVSVFTAFSAALAGNVNNPVMKVELNIPALKVNPYHKPYIAVWLETADRKYITTIKLLADDKEWYKDLRQWWRKAGRQNVNIDGVTGATKRPGLVTLKWNGLDESKQKVPAGEYWLNIEASREEGGRDYSRHKVILGQKNSITIEGKTEFGDINIHVFKPTLK